MSRRLLLLLGLSLSIATFVLFYTNDAGAFLPDDKNRDRIEGAGQSITHERITKLALLSVDKQLFGLTEANLTKEMRDANDEIAAANAKVDTPKQLGGDQFNKSASHFDGENFPGAMARIAVYKLNVAFFLNINNVAQARFYLGQALHTVQDFYSHSNWIERGGTQPWSALGDFGQIIPTFPPKNRRTCTNCVRDHCSDCVAAGTRLPLTSNELTTGYYGGDDRDKKNENPFKCSHGGLVKYHAFFGLINGEQRDESALGSLSNGINKDTGFCEISPHNTLHIRAAELAHAATIKYLLDVKDVIGTQKMQKLLGFGRTMAFAIDTTGSMGEEINAIKQKITQIVDANRGTPFEPSVYILSPFNDPNVGPLTVTDNIDTFKNALNALTAHDGGDCPELPYEGIYAAVDKSNYAGDLIMFTDAGSTFGDRVFWGNALRVEAKNRNIRIHIVYSGVGTTCGPDPLYAKLAKETGGEYLELTPDEIDDAATLSEFIFRPNLATIFRVSGPLSGIAQTFPFRIDSLLTHPSILISGTGATNIIVRRPDGSVVLSTDPDVLYISLSTGAFYSFTNAPVGTWTITINPSSGGSPVLADQNSAAVISPQTKEERAAGINTQDGNSQGQNANSRKRSKRGRLIGTQLEPALHDSVISSGEFSISVFADSSVQLSTFDFLETVTENAPHGGTFATPGGPIAGQMSVVSAEVFWDDNVTPGFEFRALDGTVLQSFTLTESEPADLEEPPDTNHSRQFIGEVMVPTVPFQVYVTGTESNGTSFQRVISKAFTPQLLKITAKSLATLSPGVKKTFSYNVQNFGPAGTFLVTATDAQKYLQNVGADVVTLATNETKEVTVGLNVPQNAVAGTLETIYVSADSTDGSGVHADASFGPISVEATPVLKLGTVTTTPTSGANSVVDPGEGAAVSIQLISTGTSVATNIQASLTSETPGVVTSVSQSLYPDIAVSGSAVNSTPFVFYVPSDMACGQPIKFTLSVTSTVGENVAQSEHTIIVQPGSPSVGSTTTTSYTGSPASIPDDDPAGVNVPIQISGLSGFINDLNFRFDGSVCTAQEGATTVGLDHTFVGDLVIKLRSPSGTTINLMDRAGGFGNNLCNTTFDDEATNSIQNIGAADAPFTGSFKPAGSLADFKGENPNGTWTLNVSDREAADVGHVRAFSMIISPVQYSCTALAADTVAPTLTDGAYNQGPPASGQILVQDSGSGLAAIDVVATDNVQVQVPTFSPGTTNAITVTGTLIDATSGGSFEIQATDVAGNISSRSRTVPVTNSEQAILVDDFNDNSLDTSKWTANDLFSGFVDLSIPVAETGQRFEIGPLLQNTSGSHYRGIRSVNSYDFTNGYSYVELVQPASSSTSADAMFTVGYSVDNYYRLYVSGGNLIGLKKINGIKTTLFTLAYNSVNHRFLRIKHDAATNSVVLETAPSNGGAPGTWTQQYTAAWNSAVQLQGTQFEVKGGTFQAETNAPGKVIFDNFRFALNAPPPTAPIVSLVCPNSGATGGGTQVEIHGANFAAGATVKFDGIAATNVSVTSSMTITAITPAHAAGAVNVSVTNTDNQTGTLANGFTYIVVSANTLLEDNFNDDCLDTFKWMPNDLFSGFTDLNIPLLETGQRLEIGPLLQNTGSSHYRGIRSINAYDFTGAYSYVELVQPASSATSADAMFTVGYSVDNYYRLYVSGGNLRGQKKIAGTKTTLFQISYDSVNHRFFRIRHDSATNSVILETAPSNGTGPGTWVQRYSETWNPLVELSAIQVEVKGGTFQSEANAPGKVIFDNFLLSR